MVYVYITYSYLEQVDVKVRHLQWIRTINKDPLELFLFIPPEIEMIRKPFLIFSGGIIREFWEETS